jgi:hypothetical protein
MVIMIVAPEGTFNLNEIAIPATIEKRLIKADNTIILLNRWVTILAMFAGMVSSDMIRMMPTALMAKTIERAMRTANE